MIYDRDKVKRLKEKFKAGTRIRLIRMDDVQAPPPGTKGTVRDVDDIGTVLLHTPALSGSHPFWRTKTKQTLARLPCFG